MYQRTQTTTNEKKPLRGLLTKKHNDEPKKTPASRGSPEQERNTETPQERARVAYERLTAEDRAKLEREAVADHQSQLDRIRQEETRKDIILRAMLHKLENPAERQRFGVG